MEQNVDKKVLEITPDVHWIGVLDRDIVTFDVVMETEFGTTYNSYFINAEKKAIVETTKEKFWDTYIEKIRGLTDPAEIEYIILNHTEPDHSGNLMRLLELAPNATVVGSGNAIRYLNDIFEPGFKHLVVKDGESLDLGNKTLKFIGAPNLHWPDSMYTYLEEDKLLFTCDSFGAHFCHEEMYDDKVGDFSEAFKYYFDVILKPFSKFMLKAIDKIRPLEIKAICTGHGPLLTHDWKKWVDRSEEYAKAALAVPQDNYVFIPYVSAYHKTGMIAEKIAEGVRKVNGMVAEPLDIEMTSLGELDARMAKSTAVLVGSPTINQNILLPVYKLFAVINPIRDKKKIAGGFGSYGWSGEGKTIIEANLKSLKLNYFEDGLYVKFTPGEKDLEAAVDYGEAIAKAVVESRQ
ncbi:MAG: FprA family A-type flavoprotein [Bacteroidales bacterium]|jgi:flavorubredoxin|nr:FprA family A-type flavoprotein [Bacteroidales bacterium]